MFPPILHTSHHIHPRCVRLSVPTTSISPPQLFFLPLCQSLGLYPSCCRYALLLSPSSYSINAGRSQFRPLHIGFFWGGLAVKRSEFNETQLFFSDFYDSRVLYVVWLPWLPCFVSPFWNGFARPTLTSVDDSRWSLSPE